MSKEIILGADRPMIGYLDERREIYLARGYELSVPLERRTLPTKCQSCEEPILVFYELSTPTKVECPGCGHENNLVKCMGCETEHEQGDQAFIELDIPDGSRVADSFLDGPVYVCSAKCLVEVFRYDIFDAKDENPNRNKQGRDIDALEAAAILGWYVAKISGIIMMDSEASAKHQEAVNEAIGSLPASGPVSQGALREASSKASEVLDAMYRTSWSGDDRKNAYRIDYALTEFGDSLGHKLQYGVDWDGH